MSLIDKLEALHKAATPGRWVYDDGMLILDDGNLAWWSHPAQYENCDSDGALIAEMKKALPKLLAVARAAENIHTEIKRTVDTSKHWNGYLSTVVSGDTLNAFVNALAALEQSE